MTEVLNIILFLSFNNTNLIIKYEFINGLILSLRTNLANNFIAFFSPALDFFIDLGLFPRSTLRGTGSDADYHHEQEYIEIRRAKNLKGSDYPMVV